MTRDVLEPQDQVVRATRADSKARLKPLVTAMLVAELLGLSLADESDGRAADADDEIVLVNRAEPDVGADETAEDRMGLEAVAEVMLAEPEPDEAVREETVVDEGRADELCTDASTGPLPISILGSGSDVAAAALRYLRKRRKISMCC